MTNKPTIGLVMIVKNEERCLDKCLSRASKLVDQIYITDTGSTDQTIEIAKKYNAHISHFTWCNDFAAARNYALAQSDCDWNLILDADEYLISGEKEDLQNFMKKGTHTGSILRHDHYLEESGEQSISKTYTIRFVPRGTQYRGSIHEQIVSPLPDSTLPLIFDHDGYLQEGKGQRNLTILLEQLKFSPRDPYLLYQTAHTLRLLKKYKEADSYFDQFCQLLPLSLCPYQINGIISWIYTLKELCAWEKGLEIIHNEEQRLANYADYHFACGIFYMHMILSDIQRYIHYLPRIEQAFLRCLEIGEVPEHEGVLGCGSFKAAYNLGVWFEVNGNLQKAYFYYQQAAKEQYEPALKRLTELHGTLSIDYKKK